MSSAASSLRMRSSKKCKINYLEFEPDKLETIRHIEATIFNSKRRNYMIKDVLGTSLCGCKAVPTVEFVQQVGDKDQPLTLREFYCDSCASRVYCRLDEKKDRSSLGDEFGVVIVDSEEMPK